MKDTIEDKLEVLLDNIDDLESDVLIHISEIFFNDDPHRMDNTIMVPLKRTLKTIKFRPLYDLMIDQCTRKNLLIKEEQQ